MPRNPPHLAWWLVLASLSAPARGADPSALFAQEQAGPGGIAARDSTVFWYMNGCGGELLPNSPYVRSEPASGPAATTIFDPGTCPTDQMAAGTTSIAVDDAYVYWGDADHHVVRQRRAAVPPEAPTIVATHGAGVQALELAADATYVYWLESRATSARVVRYPKAGGNGTAAWTASASGAPSSLQIDPLGRAYVIQGGALLQLTASGIGFTSQAFGAAGAVTRYVVAGDRAYWFEGGGTSTHLYLKSAPLGAPAQVTQHLDLSTNDVSAIRSMVADDDNVYWIAAQPGHAFAVVRWPRAGGSPVILDGYGPFTNGTYAAPSQLALAGGSLFWLMEGGNQIRALPLAAPGLDLTADGMAPQVIQVVQGPGNDVPLVAGKPTFVRVFGRIDPATTAQTSVLVNPAAALAGTRGGQALPGSPLMPLAGLATFTTATTDVRATRENGVLFALPESWTHGTITLTGTLNPMHTLAEGEFADDVTAPATVTFVDAPNYCLDVVPIQTVSGVAAAPSAQFTGFLARTVSAYPLTFGELMVGFDGGPPLRRPNVPLGISGSRPWRLDTDEDMAYLLVTMWFHDVFNTGFACPAGSSSGNSGTTVVGPVLDAGRYGMSGMDVLMFLMAPGTLATASQPHTPEQALTHELGHEFGRGHVGCPASGPGAPASPDGSYPHPACQTDDDTASAHVGFDAVSQQWMLPAFTADFMSYSASPLWASDYTYRGLLRHLGLPAAPGPAPVALVRAVPGGPPGPTSAPAAARMLVGGVLAPEPALGFAFPLDAAQALRVGARLEAQAPVSEHALVLRDARGEVLARTPLRVAALASEGAVRARAFFAQVDAPAAAARLEVVAPGGATLLARDVGPGAPTVTITQPRRGARIGDRLRVAWTASDPDRDPLLFVVRYSADGGRTWQALGSETADRALEVDTSGLPGGEKAQLQVVASDGLHAATATAGPFTVPRRPARLLILGRDGRALGPAAPAAIAQSEALELDGLGFDANDGPLPPALLSWSLPGGAPAAAEGAHLHADGLAPGRYVATLGATPPTGGPARATAAVTVLPKQVPEDSAVPRLDGACSDPAYARDADPLRLRVEGGVGVEARWARVGDGLYVCLAGLPPPADKEEQLGLRVRTSDSAHAGVGPGDLAFFVRADGQTSTAHGTEAGRWAADPAPVGLAAAVGRSDAGWSAELRVDLGRVGGWGRLVRARVGRYRAGEAVGGEKGPAWPRVSRDGAPGSWGLVALGPQRQAITFPPLPDRGAGAGAFELAAAASSGLPVTYAAGGACTVQDQRVTLTGPGACTVVARQPGGEGYGAAPPLARTFLVCARGSRPGACAPR